jgi:hypothetical protein
VYVAVACGGFAAIQATSLKYRVRFSGLSKRLWERLSRCPVRDRVSLDKEKSITRILAPVAGRPECEVPCKTLKRFRRGLHYTLCGHLEFRRSEAGKPMQPSPARGLPRRLGLRFVHRSGAGRNRILLSDRFGDGFPQRRWDPLFEAGSVCGHRGRE